MAPRDFKRRPAGKSSSKPTRKAVAGAARWPWFGAGVCVGALATAALFLYEPPPGSLAPAARSGATESGSGPRTGRGPRFEFYTLLPEKEIAIPETELAPPARSTAAATAPDTEAEARADATRYLLQVGSFRKLEDADRLKAQLAFLGLQAKIQTVSIDGTETWHRVRVGPYRGRAEVNEARERLKSNAMESLLLKLK
jgi:hypothetical protein